MKGLIKEYEELLNSQVFDETELDYSLLEKHTAILTQLAKVSNSGITVFDMYKRQHVFTSYNFNDLFGHCTEGIDERIHPDDMKLHMRNGIEALKFCFANKGELGKYKVINEFRIRNAFDQYVRVIEQFTLLEADKSGNAWLLLSILDLSPDQSAFDCVKSKVLNCKTGAFFSLQELYTMSNEVGLSPRELKILQMVKEGMLSKEISEQLFISVHTVNTHRQRILEKLNVDNSMEAVRYASLLGILY